MYYANFPADVQARVEVVRRQQEKIRQAAYDKYNEVMNTHLGNSLYIKATARDKSESKVRANALQDAALTLCGHPNYWSMNAIYAKSWDKNEIAWLQLFCVPF